MIFAISGNIPGGWVGLLNDRINNKVEKTNLINKHALNREPVHFPCPADSLAQLGEVCWAKGYGFEPRPDQHSGSLNNCEESAAFVITSANS